MFQMNFLLHIHGFIKNLMPGVIGGFKKKILNNEIL